ncbi:MAG TPA: hypothetical protein VIM65_24970, partial [Cyclobacteriaceae bacterium]
MKKLFCLLLAFYCGASLQAQQWSGSSVSTGLLYRDGNVVVGGTSILGSYSTEKVFQVQGASGSVFSLRATSSSTAFDMYLGSSYLNMNLASGTMYLSTGYVSRIAILPNGNVGIGTSLTNNPNSYKLAVKGKIGAQEVQVENTSTTWADYVFEKNYKLMSLGDVESFIKSNKHLPEIPSADEVKENGHKLGEMDVLLLKKVEE